MAAFPVPETRRARAATVTSARVAARRETPVCPGTQAQAAPGPARPGTRRGGELRRGLAGQAGTPGPGGSQLPGQDPDGHARGGLRRDARRRRRRAGRRRHTAGTAQAAQRAGPARAGQPPGRCHRRAAGDSGTPSAWIPAALPGTAAPPLQAPGLPGHRLRACPRRVPRPRPADPPRRVRHRGATGRRPQRAAARPAHARRETASPGTARATSPT